MDICMGLENLRGKKNTSNKREIRMSAGSKNQESTVL